MSAASAAAEPEVVERLRAQPAGDVAHLLEAVADRLARLGDLRPAGAAGARGGVELEQDGRQQLPDLVVELAGDAPPLALLRRERPPRGLRVARPPGDPACR